MIDTFFPEQLKNTYYAFRHGESEANVEGIIISLPSTGINNYGLSPKGRMQVEKSVSAADFLTSTAVIISSDFKRALETAEIIKNRLGAEEVKISSNLRERYFGEFEKTSNVNYEKVWDEDKKDPDHCIWNVESVNSVFSRTTELIKILEDKFSGRSIILVSHGDALQILQTAFQKKMPSEHRSLRHLETAEFRKLG